MKGGKRHGWWATLLVVLVVIAPLATLASGANGGGPDVITFTYGEGEESYPTLFIGPDRVPLATWEDPDGQLRLSRLSLLDPPKTGLVLSNLPRAEPTPIDGRVDKVAMDANHVLHVVWEDGAGGIWHKGYDAWGNVLVNNQQLSSPGTRAYAPAMAATVSEEGAAVWIVWIERIPGFGTHVRLVSLDSAGDVIDSSLVDGMASELEPRACDVAIDTDGAPHVTFLSSMGAHWAVPVDGSHEMHLVAPDNTTLPTVLVPPQGGPWAVWSWPDAWVDWELVGRTLETEGLGPVVRHFPTHYPHYPRATDLATVLAGGPLGAMDSDQTVIQVVHDGVGGLAFFAPPKKTILTVIMAEVAPSIATDDRGQTYVAWYSDYYGNCQFWVWERASDVDMTLPGLSHPDDPILVRPGYSLDVPVDIGSVVGYEAEVELHAGEGSSTPDFAAEWLGEKKVRLEPGGNHRAYVRLTASPDAAHGTRSTISLHACPSDSPDTHCTLEVTVAVPEYRPFLIRGPADPIQALPGKTISSHITLESWSDEDEVVTLTIDAPKGWRVDVPEATQLPAGVTVEVTIEVTAPPATDAGTLVDLHVEGATSEGTEGVGAHMPAVTLSHAGLALDLGAGSTNVMPGVPTTIEARVQNTGNEHLALEFYATSSIPGWSAWVTPSPLSLTPGSEAPLLVWVEPPRGAPRGAQSRVMVVAAHEDGPTLEVDYFTATVGHEMNYTALLMPMSAPLMEGRADFILELANLGNAPEELTLEFLGLPDGWQAAAGDGSGVARLATGETRRVPVVVTAPKDTSPGKVKLGMRVRGNLDPMSLWVDIHVASAFDVDLALAGNVRTLTPPGTVTFPFTMLSSGNTPGTVRLSVEGVPFGWDTALRTPEGMATVSYDMEMGEARVAHLAVKVPQDAVGQEHVMELVARSDDGVLLDRQTVFVRLRLPDLTVLDLTILPFEPREGEPLTIRARVLNLGMADAEDVSVVLKDGSRVMDRDTLHIVPRLGELEVVLYMVPGSGTRTLTIEVDPGDEVRELSEVNNIVKRRVRIAEAPEEPLMSPGVAGASVVAVVTLSIIGALGGTEYGKYAFLTLIFIPLYTKIKRDRVLDHYLRGKIHGYIIANPGEHYNAIKDQLEVTNGALSYHLRVLEREGYVRSRMDGIYKRFYPSDMKLPRTQRNISSFQEVILTIVKNNQGLSQKDIAKRIGASSQVINYHIKILEDGGLIKVDRSRRRSRVFATDAPAATVIE